MTEEMRLVPRQIDEKSSEGINPKDLVGLAKTPLRLIPPPALISLANVMALGAKKYGPFNWREKTVRRTVYLEAALRHIYTVLDGEDLDPESREPHEAHAMACMAILLDAIAINKIQDDRHTPGCFGAMIVASTQS